MCDCATEYERQDAKEAKITIGVQKRGKKAKKTSRSSQTIDARGLNFGPMISGFSSVCDGVGPWVPFIGGSAILLMLLGLLSNNVDKLLGVFKFGFDELKSIAPLSASRWSFPFAPVSSLSAASAPALPPPAPMSPSEDPCDE